MDKINQILNFWFEGITDATPTDTKKNPFKKWFTKDAKFDAQIREGFAGDLESTKAGAYKSWERTAEGRLALIILCDQFSRNIYRGTPQAFETDPIALDLALRTVKEGTDKEFFLIYRTFLYMPLMHSEEKDTQALSFKYFGDLVEEAKKTIPQNLAYYQYSFSYAKKHSDIIMRFSRFPHRNEILGRKSSSEEKQFLTQSGSSF